MRAVFILLFSVWFLLGSFMPGNDAEELAKVPFLMEHFEEHRRDGSLQDFLAFIHDHYDSSLPDRQEHQQLPFAKHLQPCLLFVIPVSGARIEEPYFSLMTMASAFPEVSTALLAGYAELWQPPRLG